MSDLPYESTARRVAPAANESDPATEKPSPGSWSAIPRTAGRRLLDALFPRRCLACERPVGVATRPLPRGRSLACGRSLPNHLPPIDLCAACLSRLAPAPASACIGCGRPVEAEGVAEPRCGACRRRAPAYDRFFWCWHYAPPLDAVLAAFKFGRLEYLAEPLGRALGQSVREASARSARIRASASPPGSAPASASAAGPAQASTAQARPAQMPTAVVFVPLHWTRRLRRGYDQAELLAVAVATELGLPCLPVLRRRRPTPPQSRLARGRRRQNLHAAFTAREVFDIRDACLLLVDDVATTGSTLGAASTCLRKAGAAWIGAATVAFTPPSRTK